MAQKAASAKKNLVIVESPSKAKTIGKFLGSHYRVVASVGHVRDLPKSKMGIDIENDFEPQYINIRGKGDTIKMLKKEAKNARRIYLATDPDREGEAISWHLAFLLDIDPDSDCRIEFNEITKTAVKSAVKQPRKIDMKLVDAQQARRVLDRLVGYSISPLLWRKIRRGLSAGRVQSAALKIICDRENEIKAFVPEEFWNIIAEFDKGEAFKAKLTHKDGKKITVRNKEEADLILEEVKKGEFIVSDVEEKERIRRPYAPFTTSTMQQDAANKLNFSTSRTMQVAQRLYEGVPLKGRGTTGLITYMRTDSVRISEEAKTAASEYIREAFGENYSANNVYTNRKKDAQDAHEAIRPSDVTISPDSIQGDLDRDQYKLYKLIWSRFVASQMKAAVYDSVSAGIENSGYLFKAGGSKLKFDGFLKVYQPDKGEGTAMPHLEKGEKLQAENVSGEQNFTQPPARFTEASLVKELEEKGIGRPSTYATIMSTLSARKYVKKEKKSLVPTELGFTVTDVIEEYFKEIADTEFTADMENKLDDVEVKNSEWKQILRDFYIPFKAELEYADEQIERIDMDQPTDEVCEICGKPMVIKTGRFGEFMACSGYPECKNTKPIVKGTGVMCPKCGKEILEKKSRRGRIFYGCSGYPECDMSYWNKPIDKKCPKCGALLVEKKSKSAQYACSNKECDYKE